MLPMPFGNPNTYSGHSGIDFPQPRGTVFKASGHGRVRNVGKNTRGGNYVWVNYDGYPAVGYHHMDSPTPLVRAGSEVWEGTPLGYVGSLGQFSTGPHLHSEVEGRASAAGYWTVFDRNRVVGQGSSSGGGSNTSTEGFLMSLSDTQQRQIYEALVVGGASASAYYKTDAIINIVRGEIGAAIASIAAGGILYPGKPYLAFDAVVNTIREDGSSAPQIDESELANKLAPALAPLIANNLGTLTDSTVDDLISRLLAEQSKRLAS